MSDIWNKVYQKDTSFFGDEPSKFAIGCYDAMEKNDLKRVLEIGCGQGRDSLFFVLIYFLSYLGRIFDIKFHIICGYSLSPRNHKAVFFCCI